jgi:hypothetical protein|tara:strand:+ start:3425 stop:3844 length:420 start_codon:yes stop_codon:yes gene_type:complete
MKIEEIIIEIRSKDYYIKLLNRLRNNGLYSIVKDEEIDYPKIVLKVVEFLDINKKYIKNFQSKDFEKIIILCIHEILTKQYSIDVDYEKLEIVLNLVKNSYLIKTAFIIVKDTFLKMYYKYKCKFCISQNDDDVIDSEN